LRKLRNGLGVPVENEYDSIGYPAERIESVRIDRKDPRVIAVAKLIIELAKGGERDPARLRDLALKSVRPE
jgi:hypothetical protein